MIPALNRISLDVAPGEVFGLVGPNGAGKTTLLKILSTLILPEEGVAQIGGFTATLREADRQTSASLSWRKQWWAPRENLAPEGILS